MSQETIDEAPDKAPALNKFYKVTFEDCCVSGEVAGLLLGYDEGDYGYHTYEFDFGTIEGTIVKLEVYNHE